jgi:hypothetical protein
MKWLTEHTPEGIGIPIIALLLAGGFFVAMAWR